MLTGWFLNDENIGFKWVKACLWYCGTRTNISYQHKYPKETNDKKWIFIRVNETWTWQLGNMYSRKYIIQ